MSIYIAGWIFCWLHFQINNLSKGPWLRVIKADTSKFSITFRNSQRKNHNIDTVTLLLSHVHYSSTTCMLIILGLGVKPIHTDAHRSVSLGSHPWSALFSRKLLKVKCSLKFVISHWPSTSFRLLNHDVADWLKHMKLIASGKVPKRYRYWHPTASHLNFFTRQLRKVKFEDSYRV